MRFILTATGLREPVNGFIPDLIQSGTQAASEYVALAVINKVMMWAVHIGIPILTEALFVWALFCFLMAVTGKGAWMERGVKSIIGFALLGVAAHAV